MNFKIAPGMLTHDRQKVPIFSGWQKDATTDPKLIQDWQTKLGPKLTHWVVPCGTTNDILVLDIDIKSNGWQTIRDLNLQIPDTFSQKTLSGGTHFIFKYPKDGRKYPNRVGFLPGLDIRSEGGYIFWYGVEVNNKPILDAPQWLLEKIRKEDKPIVEGAPFSISAPIAQVMLDNCINVIRNAPEGHGNDTLNTEAFKAGQLVASGAYTREHIEKVLYDVARERGRPEYECRATIESGLNGGVKAPLVSPFTEQPAINIPISAPSPPEPAGRWTPRLMTAEDMINTSKLRKPQLFENWSTEDIQITTADGGTGKSTLKLYEAICLALGDRFLGFENKQRGKTLFITGEDTAEKLMAMTGQIARQMGLYDPLPGNAEKLQIIRDSILIKKDDDLCLISKDKQGFLFLNPEALRKVNEAIEDIKPKMIVFDPISSFWGSESQLNDMNKVVTKFMSRIAERGICTEMINHMGKSSSANKDMSQFAGRGGSGLPSNSRVSRVLRSLTPEEFLDMTGTELVHDTSAILCNVNKFSDGSTLFNKPFVIIRDNYLFRKIALTSKKVKELEQKMTDNERVFEFVKLEREAGRNPTIPIVINHFKNNGNPIAKTNTEAAINWLQYEGFMGERFKLVPNSDLSVRQQMLIILDVEGNEI